MGYFSANRPTEKVTLTSDPEKWIEVYTDLRYGDIKQIATESGDGDSNIVAADHILKLLIVSWNLDDDSGVIVPITTEAIDQLRKEDAEIILNRVSGVVITDDAKKNSSGK